MLSLVICYISVRRCAAVAVSVIFAVSGLPSIATACEGEGEEALAVTTVEEKAADALMSIENNQAFEVEITRIEPDAGKGRVLNPRNCLGRLLRPRATCTVEQDLPPGLLAFGRRG